jgi:SRSO17 transposase
VDIAAAWAARHLDDGDAVLIAAETADEKSPAGAAGAARQYSGTVGGIALCQMPVTLTYATGRGHALIGRALYLPEACAADDEHREQAGVPEEVMFATKPQLAAPCWNARTTWGSAPPSSQAMTCTAAASCATASASARRAM